MGAAETDNLFSPTPAPREPDLSRESDGGIVCALRQQWRELESIRKGIDSNWPAGASKTARLAGLIQMQAVIAEAGRRLKARVNKTPTANVGEEGF